MITTTTNMSNTITNAMYAKGIQQGPVLGRILAFAVCPLEGICNLIAKPIAAIECLARGIFALPFSPKDSLKSFNSSIKFLLSVIPDTITLVPNCFYQLCAAMYNPKQVLPFYAPGTFATVDSSES